MIPLPFTLAEIELRERQIASRNGVDYDASDRVWLRQEAMRELAAGVLQPPTRSTRTIDECFVAARDAIAAQKVEAVDREWSPAHVCRRAS